MEAQACHNSSQVRIHPSSPVGYTRQQRPTPAPRTRTSEPQVGWHQGVRRPRVSQYVLAGGLLIQIDSTKPEAAVDTLGLCLSGGAKHLELTSRLCKSVCRWCKTRFRHKKLLCYRLHARHPLRVGWRWCPPRVYSHGAHLPVGQLRIDGVGA